jgi:hypothetical protein
MLTAYDINRVGYEALGESKMNAEKNSARILEDAKVNVKV